MKHRMKVSAAGMALAVAASPAAVAVASAPAHAAAPTAVSAKATSPRAELARMGTPQRVGQLIMVGTPATKVSAGARNAIRRYHAGSVVLTGRSHAGVTATRRVANQLQSLVGASSTRGEPLYVATDQEGGDVQVLQGSGFSRMPKAINQGSLATSTLKARAKTWAGQLRRAGVNLNLAPVMGTVSKSWAPHNKPIGYYGREYGHTPPRVATKGTAFADGMRAGGLQVAIKHFPGLGRVRDNTDTTSGVHDPTTGPHSTYLDPFETGIKAGAKFVMVSTAYYDKIDAQHPAAFSHTIVTGMLRSKLGFHGVVISDDLGAAKQVSAYSPGQRAVKFVQAGGDMVLTVKPSTVPAMTRALVARARKVPAFKKKTDNAALKVLQAKHAAGLDPHQAGGSGRHTGGSALLTGLTYRVFWVGTNGRLEQTWWSQGRWHTQSLGGGLAAPVAATDHDGRIDVFGVSGGHKLWQRSYYPSGSWGRWHAIASGFTGGVSAVRRGAAFHVFGHDDAGHLLQAYWLGHGWRKQSLGGTTSGTPAATLHGGQYDVFAVSPHGHVFTRTYHSGSWSRWHSIATGMTPALTAVWSGGGDDVFGLGSDGHMLRLAQLGDDWAKSDIGGRFDIGHGYHGPLGATYNNGRFDAYGKAGAHVYHSRTTGGHWTGWGRAS